MEEWILYAESIFEPMEERELFWSMVPKAALTSSRVRRDI